MEPRKEDVLDEGIRKSLVVGIVGVVVVLTSMVSAYLLSKDNASDRLDGYRILASKCIAVSSKVRGLLAMDNLSNTDLGTVRRGVKECKKRK